MTQPHTERVLIRLLGKVPSKKNRWSIRRRKDGRVSLGSRRRDGIEQMIDGLIAQARAQWKRKPLTSPDLRIRMGVHEFRQDRDNQVTTLLDVLVKAGVLENDNTLRCNGQIVLEPWVRVNGKQSEWTEVEIVEA